MTGQGLVDRHHLRGIAVKERQVIAFLPIGPRRLDRRDVVVGPRRSPLPHPRRLHRGERQAAAETRRLAHHQVLARRKRDQVVVAKEPSYLVELPLDVGHELVFARPVGLQRLERGRDAAARRDPLGHRLHAALRLLERAPSPGEQRVDRGELHLLAGELPLIDLAPECQAAGRARQQVVAQEGQELLGGAHGARVGLGEVGLDPRVAALGPRRRHVLAVEAQHSLELRDRHLRVDPGRVLEVDARRPQHLGNLGQTAGRRAQALARGGEIALDQGLDGARHQIEVGAGVPLEGPDRFEVEELAVEPRREHVVVQRALEREIGARHRLEARLQAPKPRGVVIQRRLRHGSQQVVVIVDSEARGELGTALEPAGEELVAELPEPLVGRLRRGRTRGEAVDRGGEAQRQQEPRPLGDRGGGSVSRAADALPRWDPFSWMHRHRRATRLRAAGRRP